MNSLEFCRYWQCYKKQIILKVIYLWDKSIGEAFRPNVNSLFYFYFILMFILLSPFIFFILMFCLFCFFSWLFLSEIIPSLHHQLFYYLLPNFLFDHSHTVCELTMKNQLNQFLDNLSISILNMFSSEVKNEHMYASSFWTCCPRSPLNQKSDVNNNIQGKISFIKNISKTYSLTAERKSQQNEMTFLNTFLKLISKKSSILYLWLQSEKKT